MSESSLTNPPPAESPVPSGSRRAVRLPEGAWLGGVATGLSAHLGWPVLLLRIGFVVLAAWQFLGVFLYGLLWLLLPASPPAVAAPGLEAATRTGLRSRGTPAERRRDAGALAALVLLALGLLWLAQVNGLSWADPYFWPFLLAAPGVGLVWQELDTLSQRGLPRRRARALDAARVIGGLLLVALGVFLMVASQAGIDETPRLLSVAGFALLGALLLAAPWAYNTKRQLARARERQLLADARADIAAHLHDSVLQTLASIQRQADDPKVVAALARRQEKELREWLYGQVQDAATFRSALNRAADEVEAEYGTPIDVVVVGDAKIDEGLDAILRAAREAMVNASKHSAADRVDVFAELLDGEIEVFVRDRGVGFDLAAVEADRLGLRRSIMDRVERHGGTARVQSEPGKGTEVRLEMSR